MILADTGSAESRERAEELRMRIEAEPWPHRAVTASIGVASWGPGVESASDMIAQADRALYFSKKRGRNRATHGLDMRSGDAPSGS